MTDAPDDVIEAMMRGYIEPSNDGIKPGDRMRAALRAADGAGWRMAPVAPTDAMIAAGAQIANALVETDAAGNVVRVISLDERIYRAMLAAAPKLGGQP